jgi:hypothetical protein
MAVVSAAGLAFGSLYAADAVPALGVTASAAGVLVPGLRAHDAFNLLVGLPLYYVRYVRDLSRWRAVWPAVPGIRGR